MTRPDDPPLDPATAARLTRRAVGDMAPLFLPAVPFGFVLGLAITESQMPHVVGYLTSVLVYAGAAQLAIVTLAGDAGFWAVVATALVINARHVMYSAALAPTFRRQPAWFRRAGPFLLIDQLFALASIRAADEPRAFRRYYLVAGLLFYTGWSLAVALGLVLGPVIPTSWRLDVAPPAMFLAIVVVGIDRHPRAVAAIVGAGVALATLELPNRLGLLVGALAGVVAGALVEGRES